MIARPVVKNKFWIVEESGKKVATIQKHTEGIAWVNNEQRQQFPSIDVLKNHYNVNFDRPLPKTSKTKEQEVYGYPCQVQPHNGVWDIRHRVPLYTETKKSKCFYAAGYYVMEGKIVFCPKYIFINRISFEGPFKSEQEAANAKISNT
jgi:hypothetical protein